MFFHLFSGPKYKKESIPFCRAGFCLVFNNFTLKQKVGPLQFLALYRSLLADFTPSNGLVQVLGIHQNRDPGHYVLAGALRKKTSFGVPCLFDSYSPIFFGQPSAKRCEYVNIFSCFSAFTHLLCHNTRNISLCFYCFIFTLVYSSF